MDPDVDPSAERPIEHQEVGEPIEPSTRVERWRRNTASGAVAGALALGLQQVFEPRPTDTVGIEQEAPTKPDDVDRVQLSFDPLDSSNNRVVVKGRSGQVQGPQGGPEPDQNGVPDPD